VTCAGRPGGCPRGQAPARPDPPARAPQRRRCPRGQTVRAAAYAVPAGLAGACRLVVSARGSTTALASTPRSSRMTRRTCAPLTISNNAAAAASARNTAGAAASGRGPRRRDPGEDAVLDLRVELVAQVRRERYERVGLPRARGDATGAAPASPVTRGITGAGGRGRGLGREGAGAFHHRREVGPDPGGPRVEVQGRVTGERRELSASTHGFIARHGHPPPRRLSASRGAPARRGSSPAPASRGRGG
jgi:hypothetical protein